MEFLGMAAAAVLIGWMDRRLKRKRPRFWRKTLLPTCVLLTALCLFCAAVYAGALWDTWISSVGIDDKIVLTVVILAAISAFLFCIIVEWRNYLRERRRWREEDAL